MRETLHEEEHGNRLKVPMAKVAKCGFGRLIDLARAEPAEAAGEEAVASMSWPIAG